MCLRVFFWGFDVTVRQLIRDFSVRENVPVDVNDVVAELRRRGIMDEIWFWQADINEDVLRGKIKHWEYPGEDGQTVRVADIDYSRSLTDDWARLVSCKETLHILDPEGTRIYLPEDIEHLVERIVLPLELQDPITDGTGVISDRVAIYQAMAVLFPWASRQICVQMIKEEKVTPQVVAKMTDLPMRYVKLVLSDLWPKLHEILAG